MVCELDHSGSQPFIGCIGKCPLYRGIYPLSLSEVPLHTIVNTEDVGLIVGLIVPFVIMTLMSAACVVGVCYYQSRRRRQHVLVTRVVSSVPIQHEVIVVTCPTTDLECPPSAVGGGGWPDRPPVYSLTPDPAEMVFIPTPISVYASLFNLIQLSSVFIYCTVVPLTKYIIYSNHKLCSLALKICRNIRYWTRTKSIACLQYFVTNIGLFVL